MNKKSITILVVCLIVSVMSVSLAFFSAGIIGNGKNVSVNAKELTINFDNNNEIASGIIEPGWSSTNTFSVENKSKTTFTYDIVLKNYKNTTKTNGYLIYKITSTNGYNMTEYKDMPKDGENTYDLVIARGITIEPGSNNKQSYTLEIKYLDSTEDQSIDMGSTVTGSLYIVESTANENNPYTKGTLGYQIMEDNTNIKERTDFSKAYTDTNIGTMYKAKEENTDVYYFAGDARNNWVKFGTFNTDKTIYKGWGTFENNYTYHVYDSMSECTNASSFNSNCEAFTLWKKGDPMYVGYIYGTSNSTAIDRSNTNNSTIKEVIDVWYKNNLNTNYGKYISTTAAYCNDRNVIDGTYNTSSFSYAGRTRLYSNKAPTYNCLTTEDKFTITGNIGNGKLTYPIALMTADEISYAGGVYDKNSLTWYYYNSVKSSSTGSINWWLISPFNWYGNAAYTFLVYGSTHSGVLGNSYVNNTLGVRPVISLKADVVYKSGDGTASSPYEIITD